MRPVVVVAPAWNRAFADDLGLHQDAIAPGFGGSSPTRLARHLHGRGHHVTVVTLSPGLAPGEVQRHRAEGLDLLIGGSRDAGRARDAFAVERRILEGLLDDAVTADAAVHAHWTYEYALAALAARADTVVTARDWGPAVLGYHRDAYRLVRLGMQVVVLRRTRHLLAVSPYLAERVDRLARVPARVIPNGLAAEKFVDRVVRPDGPATLVAVNDGFSRRKNVDTLIQAFAVVRRTHPDARLRLVGAGYEPGGAAATWATERGLAAGVEFLGRVSSEQVLATIDDAHLLVHPSREETFGNVLLEAMARGRPAVGGRAAGAVPWVLGDGGGVLVDVESADAIADAVTGLLEDADRWQAQAEAGHARARDRFGIDAVVDEHLEVYEAAVGSA